MIKWLFENRSKERSNSYMYYAAIEAGHLHVVQYLLDIKEPFIFDPDFGSLLDYSIFCNQLEIAKLLHQHNIIESEDTPIDYAALNGNIECLKWLNENTTVEASVQAMNNAALNNDLEVLKWLQQHRTEGCSDDIIQIVSRNGHIEVIQWLYENQSNVLQSQQSIDEAIAYGHLELAKWLFEKRNQQPSEDAIDYATMNGKESEIRNLQMIKWLHDNHPNVGCTEQAILNAIKHGHFETMKWLRENRTEISILKTLSLDHLYTYGVETIDWLSENFIIDWKTVLREAIRRDSSEIVDFIIKKNLTTIDVLDKKKYFSIFSKWMQKGVFSDESIDISINVLDYPLEDIEMIEFLLDKLDYPLVELKKFEEIINSTDNSNISKTLLNELIKEEINSIVGNSDRSDIPNEQIRKKIKVEH
ncbi:hypothetical protein PPL_07462 [Heterostelium album PN500]|uniref:Ankyrin repeat protein n=1 Tax=Heterostelium pallidum (strain ATCC 26659 / Pp 5 / PN500) TaxID=670386 RepID=D3BG11_HETP5|nr:hypothetical protein PPL_07462 [Heterostelium album PN500]EFA79603.1 hypothetical protein PPL_07462 [Heterostelium album PN500]|eukprot:XP_020431724.1 hypothetical protein PPL_07462 [Heterostelium album PN500]